MALEVLCKGDSLVVWKLDRLGRNVKEWVNIIKQFEERGIHFISLMDKIDTSSTVGLDTYFKDATNKLRKTVWKLKDVTS